MKKIILILILLLTSCTQTIEEKIEGPFQVTNVVDGDTLDLITSERVRLSGINTPEKGECYYKEAKEKLKELILNKKVYIEKDKTNKGKYGRLLRYVYIDNTLVNSYLVEQGYAKVYDKYKYDTKRYYELKRAELNAINNHLGVWNC